MGESVDGVETWFGQSQYIFKSGGFIGINAEWKEINFYFISVYSSCNLVDKTNLWAHLVNLKKTKLSMGNEW